MSKAAAHIVLGTTAAGAPLHIPLDIATESVAIIARKGAGKTYTGRVLAEDLLDQHVQVVVIDPLDVWWGLRLAGDGGAGGCNVVIFGGSHADLPLTETAGRALADVVVDRGISAVLVLDDLSMAAQRRFVADFCERLFERKSAQDHRTPLHVIVDEADAFAPQRVMPDATRCAGVIDRMVRRGRSRGLGTTAISQRPAVLAKDVLTQTEVLITLQVTAPQDRDALQDWVKANADAEQAKAFLGSLASLQRGQAWVWSPSRLQVFERIQVRRARTYDSSYTPKVGESRPASPRLRPVELDALRGQLANVVKEAEANDPTALRRRIAVLERAVAEAKAAPSAEDLAAAKRAGAAIVHAAAAPLLQSCADLATRLTLVQQELAELLADDGATLVAVPPLRRLRPDGAVPAVPTPPRAAARPVARTAAPRGASDASLTKAERLILTALAQYPQGRTKVQVAVLTGYAHNGGGFNNAVGKLRSAGRIVGRGDLLVIEPAGLAALGDFDPLPSGAALLEHWRGQLSKAERSALNELVEAWPNTLTREQIAAQAGYEPNGGGFNNAIGRLRTLELISGRGELRASDDLMEAP